MKAPKEHPDLCRRAFRFLLAFEFILWRNLLTEVPLTLHNLQEAPIPCADVQVSVIPERYVLILGDSIAEGLGDHLMRVVVERNRYAVAHHLQDKIGRDVISFGVRGGYPSDTYVFQSHRNWDGINIYTGIALEQPKDIVVLYSEGTDINDEMANIRFWLPPTLTGQAYGHGLCGKTDDALRGGRQERQPDDAGILEPQRAHGRHDHEADQIVVLQPENWMIISPITILSFVWVARIIRIGRATRVRT